MIKELFNFGRTVKTGDIGPQSFYFCIDKSGSMETEVEGTGGLNRFQVIIQQMTNLIYNINRLRINYNITIDLGICAFDGDEVVEIVRRGFDSSDVDDIIAWFATVTTGGTTPYDTPMQSADDYFTAVDNTGYSQSLFFLTDGTPNPVGTAAIAASNNTDMINGTSWYATRPVSIYCVGINIATTEYLELLDNTSSDGIPVIDVEDVDSLYNLLYATISQGIEVASGAWLYTSANENETTSDGEYVATVMGRGDIVSKRDVSKNSVDIMFPVTNSFAQYWITECANSFLDVIIYEKSDTETKSIFRGELSGVRKKGKDIVLTFDSGFSKLRMIGIQYLYQRLCVHNLYDSRCGVNRADYATAGTITAIADNVLTISAASSEVDGYYTYGLLDDGNGRMHYITAHTGSLVTVSTISQYIVDEFATSGSVSVTIYPGCRKSISYCHTVFDNAINMLGCPFMPRVDPWQNSSFV